MRRLTLILSDLYLPADAVRESFPTTLELPALRWLLRFADPPRRVVDWRTWLTRELGAGSIADWPVAHVGALGLGLRTTGTWMATPVALEARLDHVRLRDRGLLRVPLEQRQALTAEFMRLFGDDLSLQPAGGPSLMLCGGPEADISTTDPARLLDSDIGRALPGGSAAAGELRRLVAEIEMWLHSSPVNAAREKARQRRITSLWLWGGGAMRGGSIERSEQPPFTLHGTDDHVAALQLLIGSGSPAAMTPSRFAGWVDDLPAFIEFAPMSGDSGESLSGLEQKWFAPARDALTTGKLDSLRLVANDKVFEVQPRSGWKFWRQRRTWLESLA
jgi:hypothetical protein